MIIAAQTDAVTDDGDVPASGDHLVALLIATMAGTPLPATPAATQASGINPRGLGSTSPKSRRYRRGDDLGGAGHPWRLPRPCELRRPA